MNYQPKPFLTAYRQPQTTRPAKWWEWALCGLVLATLLAALANARTATFANGDSFPVVVQLGYNGGSDHMDFVVPGAITLTFPVPDSVADAQLINFGTGSPMTGTFGTPLTGDFAIDDYSSIHAEPVTGAGGGGGGAWPDADTEALAAGFWFIATLGAGAFIFFAVRRMNNINHNAP